jgi:hypothetical protein
MKILFIIILVICLSGKADSQIKQRTSGTTVYTGIGYKFVFLTNPTARDAYPFFQLSSGDFLKELDGFLGVSFNDQVSVEAAPGYLFSNSLSSDGFYYEGANGRIFYLPVQTNLFALPLNARVKYFPFYNSGKTSTMSKVYFGFGGGAMYISEELTSQLYTNDIRESYLGVRSYKNDFWTYNYEILLGINSFSKIGFGFEISYRFVPLNEPQTIPLITSLSGNLNSANFLANIVYTF